MFPAARFELIARVDVVQLPHVDPLNELETGVKGLRADGKMLEAQRLLRPHPEAGLMNAANLAERHLAALRKQKRALIASRCAPLMSAACGDAAV